MLLLLLLLLLLLGLLHQHLCQAASKQRLNEKVMLLLHCCMG
jgi:hypothetical protein